MTSWPTDPWLPPESSAAGPARANGQSADHPTTGTPPAGHPRSDELPTEQLAIDELAAHQVAIEEPAAAREPAGPVPVEGAGSSGADGDRAWKPVEGARWAGAGNDGVRVPTEAELRGCWPDPFAGPPDGPDAWLARLSAEELDELAAGRAAAAGPGGPDEPLAAGFTHRDPRQTAVGFVPAAGFAAGGPLDVLPPDPVLAGFAADAVDEGLGRLSDDELIGLLCAARRLSSWQAATELAAVAELDARRASQAARPGFSRAGEHVSEELAAALVLTGRSAGALLDLARGVSRLPTVLAALSVGEIDRARAAVFADELAALPDAVAAACAVVLRADARRMTTGQLRSALRGLVLAVDPDAARRRAEKARGSARVEAWLEDSGNGALAGRELPPAEMIAADQRIDAIARALKAAGAAGSLDQLRAAVFTALLTGQDPGTLGPPQVPPPPDQPQHRPGKDDQATDRTGSLDGRAEPGASPGSGSGAHLGWASGLRGSVNLTMPLATWLGLTDAPGDAAGFGALGADSCRQLANYLAAGDLARWCVTLTGSSGQALAHACVRSGPGPPVASWLATLRFSWLERGNCTHRRQTSAYQPSPKLRHLIEIRQRTCAFPGCRHPARRCDQDHTIPWDQGGRTCECGLAPLCRTHHRTKQAEGWQLDQPEPGTLVWTTPHGRSYTVRPGNYPI